MAGLLCFTAAGWGQRTVGRDTGRDSGRDSARSSARDGVRGQATTTNFNYNDISQRKTRQTEREAKQKKDAEEAKKKAEEEKRNKERADRMKKWEEDRAKRNGTSTAGSTSAGSKSTSGTRTASGGQRGGEKGKNATAPKTTGGSYDPTTREVTEVMLDAIKTQHVNFDPEEAAQKPSVILLNAPTVDPKERKRAADFGIAQPL
jgi:hypothetical protein